MKQEFTTVWGKAYVERDTLFLRSIYHPFEETAFARIGLHLLLIFLFVFQFLTESGSHSLCEKNVCTFQGVA